MRRPRTSSSPPSSLPPPLALTRVSTVCYVLRHVCVNTIADVLKIAHISDTFRDALESWSPTFWRRVAARLNGPMFSSLLSTFFTRDAFAWVADNLLSVGQLDVARMAKHPLYVAASMGAVDVVRVCIAAIPTCVDARDEYGYTALHLAARRGHTQCVRELLAAGASIKVATHNDRETALHAAVARCHVDIVRLFVAHDDFEEICGVRNRDGLTAWGLVCSDEVAEVLPDRYDDGDDDDDEDFYDDDDFDL